MLIPFHYRSKPLLGATLDSSSPLSRGLVSRWLLNEGNGGLMWDLGRFNPAALQQDARWVSSPLGPGVRSNAVGNVGALVLAGTERPAFTYLLWFVPAPGYDHDAPLWSNANSYGGFAHDRELYLNSSGQVAFYIFDGGTKVVTSTTTAQAGVPMCVVAAHDGVTMSLYINGRLEASTACGPGYNYTTGVGNPPVAAWGFGYQGSGSISGQVDVLHAGLYGHGVTADAARSLYTDPFSMVALPALRRFYAPQSAAPPAATLSRARTGTRLTRQAC